MYEYTIIYKKRAKMCIQVMYRLESKREDENVLDVVYGGVR